MTDELTADDSTRIADALAELVAAGMTLTVPLLELESGVGTPAALQRADRANYARTPHDDSAVAGAQDAIVRMTLAALDHASGFATLVRHGHSLSPAVLARAGVEALGLGWYQLSAPDVHSLLARNINIRRSELYFPAQHGVQLEDEHGGTRYASALRDDLTQLMKERGFAIERVSIPTLAGAVIDAALGGNGDAHYSQLSTVAHGSLPAVAMHLTANRMRPSRAMVITAAVDLTSPLIHVIGALAKLFGVRDPGWARTALATIDVLDHYNQVLNAD